MQLLSFTIEDEEEFFHIFRRLVDEDVRPEGYGLLEEELDDDEAEMIEVIPFGTQRSKTLTISLTDPVWSAWITIWAQAVELLSVFQAAS